MIAICVALEVGVLVGVPMRPEEIEELMRQMSEPKLARTLPAEEDAGDDDATDGA